MNNGKPLTYESFRHFLEKWDEYFLLSDQSGRGNLFTGSARAIKLSDFAEEFWQSFFSESYDMQDLYEQALAKVEVDEFRSLYSDPEEIARYYINPGYVPVNVFKHLSTYAQDLILEEKLLDVAVRNYQYAEKIASQKEDELRKKQERQRQQEIGTIYLLRSQYGYKIGKTADFKKRTKLFSVKLPFKFDVLYHAEYANYHVIEEELHEKFKQKHINGEWFDLTYSDIEYIKGYKCSQKIEKQEEQ